jgi:hypothetical protein
VESTFVDSTCGFHNSLGDDVYGIHDSLGMMFVDSTCGIHICGFQMWIPRFIGDDVCGFHTKFVDSIPLDTHHYCELGNKFNPGKNLTLVTKVVTKAITCLKLDRFR